jgi:(E)-benzylidenesuccinyl-CoA hydratase
MSVDLRIDGHVAYITLNRPEAMNALDPEALEQLKAIWNEVREDPEIRVSVLTGAGTKAFCTGTDMKKAPPPTECMAATYLRDGMPLIPYMKMWKPIIAAINGYAVGGGLEIALACDLRIASTTARFGLTETKVASLAGLNGTQCLPRAIPQAIAMKMILTGELIDGQEAHRVGLVSDLVEPDALMGLARKYAERIAANAPLSVKAAKQAVVLGMDMPRDYAIAFGHLLWGVLRDTEDRKEGFTAFAEKREPQYKGR